MTTSHIIESPPKTRANSADEKARRRSAILDAAERLLSLEPDRVSLMSEVAQDAGVAKGTLYLYFQSKESLLLALHERHCDDFFAALIERLTQSTPATFDDIATITQTHMIRHATYLPCATVCFGGMERNLPLVEIQAHMTRISNLIAQAAHGMARHFAPMAAPDAAKLLTHSYGLILGMWQMLKPEAQARIDPGAASGHLLRGEFAREVDTALRALWTGTFLALGAPSQLFLKTSSQ